MIKPAVSKLSLIPARLLCFAMLLLLVFQSSSVFSQQESPVSPAPSPGKSVLVYPSFGVGFGFFNPSDVNEYIQDELGSYELEYGTTDIFLYFKLHAGVTIRMKQFDVSALLEYDLAPKFISNMSGGDYTYMYQRIAPGVDANYYVPVGTGRHAVFFGGGFNVSLLSFENFKAVSPGFDVHVGYSLQFGKFNLQPYLGFAYASGNDKDDFIQKFALNYTSAQIGVKMSFHPRMNYK
jgi:hypothetical protein